MTILSWIAVGVVDGCDTCIMYTSPDVSPILRLLGEQERRAMTYRYARAESGAGGGGLVLDGGAPRADVGREEELARVQSAPWTRLLMGSSGARGWMATHATRNVLAYTVCTLC